MDKLYTKINFLVTGFISILGFTMIYEIISEDDMEDKIDDALLTILGLVAIWWYKKTGHKGESGMPAVIISGLAVCTKILAMAIEHADKEALGDDIGILVSLLLLFIFVLWQVFSKKRVANKS